MAKQLNVNLAFTADTGRAKAQLQDLQSQLTRLINQPTSAFGSKMAGDIEKASLAAAQLKVHLDNATNVDTGTLDFAKLDKSLKKSGVTLETYAAQIRDMGPEGAKSFMMLAEAIANAEVPIRRSNALLNEMWTTMKNTVRWQISSSVLHGFMGALQTAYGYSQDLNESLNNIRIVSGKSVDEMAQFAVQANKAAKALSSTTTEYTNAALIYYQQGLQDSEIEARTETTLKMANVSRQSAEIVSDQMTAIWNNFYDGSKSIEYYADVITALGAATASSSDEIAEGLEKFAAVSETVGLSYEYATAALATVTATTRQSADIVGNAFKTLFARIQGLNLGETLDDGTTLNKYSQALDAVGISIFESNGQIKEMDDILDEMGSKWGTLNKAQQTALAQTVAGVRQYNQLIALMDNWEDFQTNLGTANTATGTLEKQQKIYEESWEAANDRVRAAFEGIYETLINDEFFIDLLNITEKLVSGFDELIDRVGGLKGVMTGLGLVFTKVFSKQLSSTISDVAYNLSGEKGREKIIQGKIDSLKSLSELVYDVDAESDTIVEENYQKILKAQIESQINLIANAKNLTEEEQKTYQYLLDQQKVRGEIAIEASKNQKKIENRYEQIEDDLLNEIWDDRTLDIIKEKIKDLEKEAEALAKLDPEKNKNEINQKKKEIRDIELDIATTPGGPTLDTTKEFVKVSIEKQKVIAEANKETKNASKVLDINSVKTKENTDKIKENNSAIKEKKSILDKLDSKDIVATAEALSQVGFGASSIKSAFDTLQDTDLSPLEKIQQISVSLAMGLPTLIDGLKKLNATSIGLSITETKLAKKVAELTGSIFGAQAAVLGMTATIGIAIGALALLAFAIKKSYDEFNKDAIQAEKAAAAVEQFTENTNKAKESLDQLKEGLSNYEEFQITLNGLNEGTKEWNETLQKSNEKILELIEKYPELSKYFESDGSRYSFSEGYQDVLSDLENNYIRLSSGLNLGKMSSISATNQNLQTEFLRDDNTSSYLNQNLLNIIRDAYNKDPNSINNLNEVLEDQGIAQSVIDSIATNTDALKDLFDELNTNTAQMKVLAEINSKNINSDNEDYNNLSSKDQSLLDSIIANRVSNDVSEEDIQKYKNDLGKTTEYYSEYLKAVFGEEADQYRILAGSGGKNTLQKLNDYGTYDTVGEKGSLTSDYMLDYLARKSFTEVNEDDFEKLRSLQETGNSLSKMGVDEEIILQIQKDLAEGFIPDLILLTKEQIESIRNSSNLNPDIQAGIENWNETDHQNAVNKNKVQQIEGIFSVGEKELEYSKEALESYTESLIKNNKTLKGNEVEAAKVAVAHVKLGKGLNKIQDALKDNADAFAEADEESLNYNKAISELGEALTDAFGFEVDTEFVKEHLSEIQAAANGGAKEIQNLQNLLNKDFIMKLDINEGNKERLIQELEELSDLALDNTISTDLKIDNQNAIAAINEALVTGEATIEDIEKMFNNANLQMPEYKTIEVPGDAVKSESETTFEGPFKLKYTAKSTSVTRTNKVIPYFGDTPPKYSQDEKTGKITWKSYGGMSEGQARSGGLKVDTLNNADSLKNALDFNEDNKNKGDSSKKDFKEIDDEIDRYHEIKEVLEDLNRSYDNISKQKDRAFGQDKINLINDEISALENLADAQKIYLNEIEKNLKSDQSNIKRYGAIIKDGKIINYDEIFKSELNKYNSAVSVYNKTKNETQFEASEKRYEDFKKALSQYEETSDLLEQEKDKLNDFINNIQDKNYEQINLKLELQTETSEDELQKIDYYTNKIKDNFYQMAESGALLANKLGPYKDQLEAYNNTVEELNKQYLEGLISQADYHDGLKEAKDGIYDQLNNLIELEDQMKHYYGDTLEKANEELSKYTDNMDHLTSVLNHYKNIVSLINGEYDYDTIGKIVSGQAKTIRKQLEVSTANYNMLLDQKESIEKSIAKAITDTDKKMLQQQLDDIIIQVNEAQEKVLSDTEQWVEAIKSVLQNTMAEAAKFLENQFTNGMGFDALNDSLGRLSSYQDEYLTKTNQMYETQKMLNTAQQAIDKTTNLAAKERIRSFIKETEQLQNKNKLSNLELEIQQARYNVLLAEIALEEAQNAKTTVRLQRDSEGNFGYVYTADQEAISNAEQDLADAQNDLYNIGLKGVNDYGNKILKTQQELANSLQELEEKRVNGQLESEQAYQEERDRIVKEYTDLLTSYSEQYKIAFLDDERIKADAWIQSQSSMIKSSEEWAEYTVEYTKKCEDAYSKYKNSVDENSEIINGILNNTTTEVNKITFASEYLADTIKENIIPSIDEELTAVRDLTAGYVDQIKALSELISLSEQYAGTDSNTTFDPSVDYTAAINYGLSHNIFEVGSAEYNALRKAQKAKNASLGNKYDLRTDADYSELDAGRGDQAWFTKDRMTRKQFDEILASVGFDTGGYTGQWGPNGKVGILHQKELVLNEKDTKNFLSATQILRNISDLIDLEALHNQLSTISSISLMAPYNGNNLLEQVVQIEANFPNATDRYEIEEAFNNILNTASQYANRKNG